MKSCCAPGRPADETVRAPVVAAVRPGTGFRRQAELAGGPFLMGTDSTEAVLGDGEGPVREIELDPFRIDVAAVDNESFAEFVGATGYTTDSERFGWSFVFEGKLSRKLRRSAIEARVPGAPWWCKIGGADWRHPEGPGSSIARRGDHPVVQVSWHDAVAFCAWAGMRLPTEAEWEYAARGGLVQRTFPWGDELEPNGEHRCNVWQGTFPQQDLGEDGYRGTCPVDAFPANGFGLYNLTGNAWEWCADWFDAEFHRHGPSRNPTGPTTGTARVMRGGSYLCHASYCNRYRVSARSSNTPDSATGNLGFRCAAAASSRQ